jgi:hypothetical protein
MIFLFKETGKAMPVYQHLLWGYELTYPVGWVQRSFGDGEGFASIPEAFEQGYEGPNSGHILVRADWNSENQAVEPLWNDHIARVAGMMGAKQVGSAPWRMGGGVGLEAEIVLPKKNNRRLWAGMLAREFIVLQFLVTHPAQDRAWFEPAATQIISSLSFASHTHGIQTGPQGLPIPPGFTPVDPRSVIPDIQKPENWRAFAGQGRVGELQAFYYREASNYGWEILEFLPFPSSKTDLNFARLSLRKESETVTLGIMPDADGPLSSASQAKLVAKYE